MSNRLKEMVNGKTDFNLTFQTFFLSGTPHSHIHCYHCIRKSTPHLEMARKVIYSIFDNQQDAFPQEEHHGHHGHHDYQQHAH